MPESCAREWKSDEVSLYWVDKDKKHIGYKKTLGLACDGLIIHLCLEDKLDGKWAVTHQVSGRRIMVFDTGDAAAEFANQMIDLIGVGLLLDNYRVLVEKCPESVKKWVVACQKSGKHLSYPLEQQ